MDEPALTDGATSPEEVASNALRGIISGQVSTDSATTFLPVGGVASGTAPDFVVGPYTPTIGNPFKLNVAGNDVSCTIQLQRSVDKGVTRSPVTEVLNYEDKSGELIEYSVLSETDPAATYYLAVHMLKNAIIYRIG